MQCVKVGPAGGDARDISPDMFDATKAKDIRCGGGAAGGGALAVLRCWAAAARVLSLDS